MKLLHRKSWRWGDALIILTTKCGICWTWYLRCMKRETKTASEIAAVACAGLTPFPFQAAPLCRLTLAQRLSLPSPSTMTWCEQQSKIGWPVPFPWSAHLFAPTLQHSPWRSSKWQRWSRAAPDPGTRWRSWSRSRCQWSCPPSSLTWLLVSRRRDQVVTSPERRTLWPSRCLWGQPGWNKKQKGFSHFNCASTFLPEMSFQLQKGKETFQGLSLDATPTCAARLQHAT